jgi:hypothetical protein
MDSQVVSSRAVGTAHDDPVGLASPDAVSGSAAFEVDVVSLMMTR